MLVGSKNVNHSLGNYDILLHRDFTGLSGELLKLSEKKNISNLLIITERNIAQLYIKYLESELKGIGIPVNIVFMKGGEKNKHIDRVKKIYHQMVDLGCDRKTVVLALGGGVVGDFAGFIASTYQRGVRFVQIPTTLLASVDSSVGGKVAVNLNRGKNMVGTFHQPELVFMPLFTLSTLPKKEWRCGLAEICKHSLLSGGEMWEDFRSHTKKDIHHESEILVKMVLDSVGFKSKIVSQDEKEGGLRAILNFGHTTAHAIESYTKYSKYSHGEAVAIGMVTALLLSSKVLEFPKEKMPGILEAMKGYDLPVYDSTDPADLVEHMEHDKKKEGNALKFVLLRDIGHYEFGVDVARKDIQKIWKEQVSFK